MKAFYLNPKKRLDYDIASVLCGLEEFGYQIYEIDSIENAQEPSLENIYIGCVNSTKKIFKRFGIPFPFVPDYPKELKSWFGREIESDTWDGLNHRPKCRKFVKPKVKGLFTPFIGDFPNYDIDYLHISEDCEVWISEPIQILSEYRAFIKDSKTVDVRRYKGWYGYDQELYIPETLTFFNNEGKPFVMDFAIIYNEENREPVVLECNPGICFGSYGLNPKLYADMLIQTYKHL